MEPPTIDVNDIFKISYEEKISRAGFCIGVGASVFTKNETTICGLKHIDMAEDCINYEFVNPGYYVNDTLILPCKRYMIQGRIVMDATENGSSYQSPNFNILLMSMMVLFIFFLKR